MINHEKPRILFRDGTLYICAWHRMHENWQPLIAIRCDGINRATLARVWEVYCWHMRAIVARLNINTQDAA